MKIYISKSNQANPDDLINARAAIKEEGNEIVEYLGGQYDKEYTPIKQSGGVVVIPPGQNNIIKQEDVDYIYVGKGNFSEIMAHIKHMEIGEQESNARIFKDNKFYKVIKLAVTRNNWQTEFAKLFIV